MWGFSNSLNFHAVKLKCFTVCYLIFWYKVDHESMKLTSSGERYKNRVLKLNRDVLCCVLGETEELHTIVLVTNKLCPSYGQDD